jgi:hypothetical protein
VTTAVFDVEANGLKPTLLHCLSVNIDGKKKSTTDYDNMRSFFAKATVLIGHNIARWDIPNVERLLGIKIKAKVVDTLALSWYLEPKRVKHGLAEWGEEFGVPKPPVDDWEDQPIEAYLHRCEQDVAINTKLWNRQWKQLVRLYGSEEAAWRLIDYLEFKMDCAREQEQSRWKLDVEHTTEVRDRLKVEKDLKTIELAEAMPRLVLTTERSKPPKMYYKGKVNTLNVAGQKWFELLREHNLLEDYEGVVQEITGYKEPNPGSPDQVKQWLYSFGWVPETFEFKRNKETGEVRQIPQVNLKMGGGICKSIKKLYPQEPKFKVLEGLSVLTHRISILNGFLNNVDSEGYVQAQVQGLTNTLRFKHRVVVNLPGVDKPYGADVRGCLVAPEGYELAGSDESSLEDRTKQHWMWKHDPEYVKEMQVEGYDPHTALAVFAGEMTKEEEDFFKWFDGLDEGAKAACSDKEKGIYKKCKAIRKIYKAVNYACVYGAGGATVARAAGCTLQKGEQLVIAYWKRNWSVKAIAEEQIVKTCLGMKWLFNPLSQFWYALRHEKDRFSTLNQGTGVYCFDMWVQEVRVGGPTIIGQFHDEIVCLVKPVNRGRLTKHLKDAIVKVNGVLNLNRELDCSVDFGESYAQIH